MASNNECWGLEIGASAVKALKLERVDENSVRMIDYAVVQHPKVLSTPDVKADDVIRLSMQQLISQFDLSKGKIAVSVPGHAAFARFCKLPPVEPKKVPDIVRFEAMQQIPVSLDEVEWDYQTFVTPDSPDVGVGIFAMRRDNLKERLQLLADFGITPESITLSPLAIYNAMAYDLEFGTGTTGTIIVDIGTTSTDIVVSEPGRMWIRTFPMGGHQFTEAIVQAFNLSYSKAEKLKREAEQTEHARRVFQEMRPVFTDLATEIQRSIGYYQSLHKDAKIARIIGVGSTFRLPGLRKYFKQQLGLEVYRVEEFKRIKPPEGMSAERIAAFNDLSLNMGTAYGLCLQGLELNACGGNLMPVTVVRDTAWRRKTPWFATAAAVSVAASAAFFARPVYDSTKIKARIKDPVIGQAIEAANRSKGDATKAGVIGGAQANYTAANLVDVTSRRDVYPRIVADVGEMISTGARDYALSDFHTSYEPPLADPNATPQGSNAPGSEIEPGKPKIRCVLELTTDKSEPQRYVKDTIEKWLDQNKARQGVPYRLILIDTRVSEGAAADPATPDRGPAPRAPDERPGGRPGGLRPGGGMNPMGAPPPTPPPSDMPSADDDVASISRLNEIAPIPALMQAPGRTRVVIEWYAVVLPPEAGKEGGSQ